jgi:hypothetical protein
MKNGFLDFLADSKAANNPEENEMVKLYERTNEITNSSMLVFKLTRNSNINNILTLLQRADITELCVVDDSPQLMDTIHMLMDHSHYELQSTILVKFEMGNIRSFKKGLVFKKK